VVSDLKDFLDGDDGVWYDRFGLWTQGKRDTAWLAGKLEAAGVTLAATPTPLDEGIAARLHALADKHADCDCSLDEAIRDEAFRLAATPAPLDVERLARVIVPLAGLAGHRMSEVWREGAASEIAAAIAAAYAEEADPLRGLFDDKEREGDD
jgi:ribosomal protein L12E/L44/L45/RPP1/RPP2